MLVSVGGGKVHNKVAAWFTGSYSDDAKYGQMRCLMFLSSTDMGETKCGVEFSKKRIKKMSFCRL